MADAAPGHSPDPAPNHARLPLADQLMVNLLAMLVVQRIISNRTPVALAELRRALPFVSAKNPHIAPLAAAARRLVDAAALASAERGMEWCSAHLGASRALEDFFYWRGALVHNALNPQVEDVA